MLAAFSKWVIVPILFTATLSGCTGGFHMFATPATSSLSNPNNPALQSKNQSASDCSTTQVLIYRQCVTVPSANILAPHAAGQDDLTLLKNAIDMAKSKTGPVIIQLEARIYHLACGLYATTNGHCLIVDGLQQLKIQGVPGKTQLLLDVPLKGAFWISGVQDFTLQGLIVDYSIPPYSQGTVTAVRANQVTVYMDPNYYDLLDPNLIGDCTLPNSTCTLPLGEVFGPDKVSKAVGIWDYISTTSIHHEAADRTWTIATSNTLTGENGFVAVGDIVAFTPSTAHAIETYSSANVSFYQIEVRAAPGVAFLFNDISGYLDLDTANVALTPGTTRVLSTNYDAYHVLNSRAPLVLRNSSATNNGDDFLNISTLGWTVVSISGSTLEIAPSPLSGTVGAGDFIQITDSTVANLKLGNGGNASVVEASTDSNGHVHLTLDASISSVIVGDQLFNLSTSSPYSVISNNTFGTHRGAIRMRSPGGQFTDNQFPFAPTATLLYSVDDAWDQGGQMYEGAFLPPPQISGNLVAGGKLRLYGPNWNYDGAY